MHDKNFELEKGNGFDCDLLDDLLKYGFDIEK